MRVATSTLCSPRMHIETFTPGKPPLPDLLWALRNELKAQAATARTGVGKGLLRLFCSFRFTCIDRLLMRTERMSTEAPTTWPRTCTKIASFFLMTSPHDVDTSAKCFSGGFILHTHHRLPSWCCAILLYSLADRRERRRLNHDEPFSAAKKLNNKRDEKIFTYLHSCSRYS